MKKILLIGVCFWAFSLFPFLEVYSDDEKIFALVNLSSLDNKVVDHARKFAELNLSVPVHMLELDEPVSGGLDKQAQAVSTLFSSNHLAVVALVEPSEKTKHHGLIVYSNKVAVINVPSLKDGTEDHQQYQWRLDRQVIRSFGFLAGREYCSNPSCVLKQYRTLKELDQVGRNFCPPDAQKFRKEAKVQGAQFLPRQ
ncbi:MAG: hypothetical protein GKR87_10195 [Kiritimatiellae bacterium]|nr:hypothetical protein [Kiritimatiellia bacterium]